MVYTSLFFIIYYLPFAFILYHICFFSLKLQNILLLFISLLFYAFGQTVFIYLLLFSILWNWGAGLLIGKLRDSPLRRKIILGLAVLVNIAVLVFFKQLNPVLSLHFSESDIGPLLRLGLPLGLSWFTLQGISYLAGVYRGEHEAERNPVYVGLYLSFFPKLAAGPLISYPDMKKQMLHRTFSLSAISRGFCRFTSGLAKVVLVGNFMARVSDYVFSWSAAGRDFYIVPVSLAWLGLLAFMLRMYHQLSGFCDMAIGLAMIFEYRLPENFSYPYAASSLKEFWQRWNITLLNWFRNYAYDFFRSFGRRITNADVILINLFITWFLYALWHGTSWSIMFWGALQFFFLLAEHFLSFLGGKRGSWYMRLYFWAALFLSFVFLRTENLYVAGTFFKNLFGLNNNGILSDAALVFLREYWLWFLTGIAACFPVFSLLRGLLMPRLRGKYISAVTFAYPLAMTGLLVLIFVYLLIEPQVSFAYF